MSCFPFRRHVRASGLASFFLSPAAATQLYTLSLHDALPISGYQLDWVCPKCFETCRQELGFVVEDRKSTRLNSSHRCTSYAVFCLKKKRDDRCTGVLPRSPYRVGCCLHVVSQTPSVLVACSP